MSSSPDEHVYNAFASIYDRVMRDVDYDSWSRHILNLAERYDVKVNKILELACGTGSMILRLASMGYQIIGVDRSKSMLDLAQEKLTNAGIDAPLLEGMMESFSHLGLAKDFDLIACLYDSLNYILEEEGVTQCFEEANLHLRPGGAFIFDVTSEYNLLHNFAGYTYAENFEEASYIWENEYNLAEKLCKSKVTIFTHVDDRYYKHVEMHKQRVYSTKWLTKKLEEKGFQVKGTFHNLTTKPVKTKCERIHFVCVKV